jgi:RHS repeat-associated protein
MQMPGRSYSSGSKYRYGFNGQENSDEIAAGLTTAMYWEYDSRIGRRWNIDPVEKVDESPYLCFSGNPIFYSDPLGNVSKGPNDWIKTKNADGTTSYKWDDKAVSPATTPAGSTYVGPTGKYPQNANVDVSLFAKGNWFATSGVTATSGSKDAAPPAQEASTQNPVQLPAYSNKQNASFSAVDPYSQLTFFERGMIKDNIATDGSIMLITGGYTKGLVGKLVANSAVQLSVNGKNADFADVAINSFGPNSYVNGLITPFIDIKPLADDNKVKIGFVNKGATEVGLDLAMNHVFYGLGRLSQAPILKKPTAQQALVASTVNSAMKAVIKKTYSDAMFPKTPQTKNSSDGTQAPAFYNPGLKR